MRRWPTGILFSALALAGCRSRSDLVEAELRTKDRQLREIHAELGRTMAVNQSLDGALREQRAPIPGGALAAGPVVKDMQIGRGTGGIDEDRIPGDEGLLVVVVPRDSDGTAIKATGSLHVDVLEVTPEGLKAPFANYDLTALELRPLWAAGLLSSGYQVKLPFRSIPRSEKLRIIAQFTPAGGATYEAERDVQIRLVYGPAPAAPPVFNLPPPTPAVPKPTPTPMPTPAPPLAAQPVTGGSYITPPVPDPTGQAEGPVIVAPPLPLTQPPIATSQ